MEKSIREKINFRNIIAIILFVVFLIVEFFYLNKNNTIKVSETNSYETSDNLFLESSEVVATISDASISKEYKFATVSETYFDNTLFIGDSRMLGFSIYKQIEGATYYCYQSADAFTILDKEYEVKPYGMISLYTLISLNQFDKIYISLGINNVGAGYENHKKHFNKLIDTIIDLQPNAIIYLLANLHVTSELKLDAPYLTNENINNINKFISQIADDKNIFYLDPNVMYDDEYGNMDSELSYDNAHIYLRHYDRYLYFLLTHAVVYE